MTEDDSLFQVCDIILARIAQEEENIPLSLLSKETIEKSNLLNRQRRLQFLTGRALLAQWLYQTRWIRHVLPEIVTNKNGRPAFCDEDLPDFNISHCGDYIMLAINQDGLTGIDLEQKRPRKKLLTLAQYCFSDLEYQWLSQLPAAELDGSFWRLWTLRESLLKQAGLGVWHMKTIAIDPYQHKIFADNIPNVTSFTYQQNDLFWSLTTNNIQSSDKLTFWQASADLQQFQLQDPPEPVVFKSNQIR